MENLAGMLFFKKMKVKEEEGEVVLIKRMKTKKAKARGKRGVHKGDESQKSRSTRETRCSSSK
ncbi:hypothetical protein A499_04341 [Niallia nealsonii AAU1]|nr:hypothetical protein A499_04341 [Niallia nealsonii AAU1]